MPGLDLKVAKRSFFNRGEILSRKERGQRRALRRWGSIVRQQTRRNIKIRALTVRQQQRLSDPDEAVRRRARRQQEKKRRATSPPGTPPFAHSRDKVGIRFILFIYERHRNSVVVGYVKFNAKGQDVPHSLEYGGLTTVNVYERKGGRLKVRQVTVRIRPRPNINPTSRRLLPKFRQFLRDMIR